MTNFHLPSTRAVLILLAVAPGLGCGDGILYPFPEGMVFFESAPIDLAGVEYLYPMGGLNVLPSGHGGFSLAEPYEFPASVPVLAVAGGVITRVSNGTRAVPDIPEAPEAYWGREYDDHLIELKVSETITVNYAHVTTWSPRLEAEFGDMSKTEEGRRVSLVVQAGDTLGFVGPHGAMDFSVTDFSLELNLLNRSLYSVGHRHSAHVLDYFREPIVSDLEAIAIRQEPPRAGKIDYDVEGRIVGNWFLEGTEEFIQWSRQLAIAYHDIFGDRITIADGSPMRDVPGDQNPGAPDVYWVRGNSPRPEEIGVGDGIVRYTLIHPRDGLREPPFEDEDRPVVGLALVEMIDPGRIRFEVFRGSADPEAFTSAAKIYVR